MGKTILKKWWIWLIAFIAVLAIIGISQAKTDIANGALEEEEVEVKEESEEESEEDIKLKESDQEMVNKYVDSIDSYTEELENEYAARVETNNMDSWGPFFKEYKDRINTTNENIKEAELSEEDIYEIGLAHTNLIMLATEYGKAISGETDDEMLKFYKEEIEHSRSQYE